MATQEAVMTTQEIADRFNQLAQENNWEQIQQELFSDDAESVEPAHALGQGPLRNAKGREDIKKKGQEFGQTVEAMHGGYSSKPVVSNRYFAVSMGMDVTMKGMGRMNMDEIAMYEVKDGKIVKEQFFY